MAINPTPRDLKKEENRQKISKAAMKLYESYSFEEVSVADICKACDISVGSFYHLYGSKENTLFLALAVRRDRYIRERFTVDESADFFQQFYDFVMVNIEHNVSVTKSLLGATYAAYVTQKCTQDLLPGRTYCDGLASVVHRGCELGAFTLRLNESEMYRYMNMLIIGIAEDWCAHNDINDVELCRKFARETVASIVKREFIPERYQAILFD